MPGSARATAACNRRITSTRGRASLHGVEVSGQQVEEEAAAHQAYEEGLEDAHARGDVVEAHDELDKHGEGSEAFGQQPNRGEAVVRFGEGRPEDAAPVPCLEQQSHEQEERERVRLLGCAHVHIPMWIRQQFRAQVRLQSSYI